MKTEADYNGLACRVYRRAEAGELTEVQADALAGRYLIFAEESRRRRDLRVAMVREFLAAQVANESQGDEKCR